MFELTLHERRHVNGDKHVGRCLALPVIRKMQLKPTEC